MESIFRQGTYMMYRLAVPCYYSKDHAIYALCRSKVLQNDRRSVCSRHFGTVDIMGIDILEQ